MIFSVSEANNFIKALLDAVPQLQTIFVRGEISNYKLYPSGHHYFTLKDEGSALKCVMFRGMAGKLRFRPENGMKVIAFGRIGVFPRDGAYQLYCSELSAAAFFYSDKQKSQFQRFQFMPLNITYICHLLTQPSAAYPAASYRRSLR